MTWEQILVNFGGGAGVVGVLLASLRSPKFRATISRLLTETGKIEASIDSLRSVVEAQGESIEWLRGELDATRHALEEARMRLRETEALAIENAKLRVRVAELEAHVGRLEDELRRRRGGRPKKDVVDL